MNKSRLEWKVGLFVFFGLVLLAGLLLEFSKGLGHFRSTYDLYLQAENAGNLVVNAQVRMSGVQVGTVSDIKLAPSGKHVVITLGIYSQYSGKIYKDARFLIETSGFLGDQYVAIVPTSNAGAVFQDKSEAQAEPPFDLQEVARSASGFIQRIDDTTKKLNDAINDIRRQLLTAETLTNLAASARNLRAASERAVVAVDGINALVATNAPALAASGSNLVAFSEHLNQVADGLNAVVATNAPDVHAAVKNIESSAAVLKDLMNEVQAGKGLAGGLLKNDRLAADLSQIMYNLSITTSNLNRQGLWGILWAHKPPRTSAPATTNLPALTTPKNPFEE